MSPEAYRKLAAKVEHRLAALAGLGVIVFFSWILSQAFLGGR